MITFYSKSPMDSCCSQRKSSYRLITVYCLIISITAAIYNLLMLYCYYDSMNNNKAAPLLLLRESGELLSTCSFQSDARGFHQNVIAFSLYGQAALSQPALAERYLKPLQKTALLLPKLYPGWIMRIYHNITEENDMSLINQLFSSYSHVDLCNTSIIVQGRNLPSASHLFAMTWRFLPLLDNLVDRFMSRDSDSPILKREIDAVNQWLESNKTFHVIRDHPNHCVPMLGGLWGAKLSVGGRSKIYRSADKLLRTRHDHRLGFDQYLLSLCIWPLARRDLISHDAYCCTEYPSTLPHPNKRHENDFVGMVPSWSMSSKLPECPAKCRPKYGSHWSFC